MKCTKTIYPHSKYNYVSCTNFVERFGETSSTDATDSSTTNNTMNTPSTNGNILPTIGSTTLGSILPNNNNIMQNPTGITTIGSTLPNNIMQNPTGITTIGSTLPNNIMENPTGIITIGSTLPNNIMESPSIITASIVAESIKEMAEPTIAVVSTDTTKQSHSEETCDKKSLYITIGVLSIFLIILIAYIIYQSGKNSQR
jgi:hypothetical protein